MVEISPSILAASEENFAKEIYSIEVAGADYVHVDVMDNIFVPNETHMLERAGIIKQISNLPLDVHLMVKDVKAYTDAFLTVNPNIITFHLEAIDNIDEMLNYIKQNNVRVGLSVKPKTKVEELYPYLDKIHMALIMTVEPGFGGQKLILETIEKVRVLKKYIDDNNLDVDIEVDGGVTLENAQELKDAGANILVAGTTVFKAEDRKKVIEELKKCQ